MTFSISPPLRHRDEKLPACHQKKSNELRNSLHVIETKLGWSAVFVDPIVRAHDCFCLRRCCKTRKREGRARPFPAHRPRPELRHSTKLLYVMFMFTTAQADRGVSRQKLCSLPKTENLLARYLGCNPIQSIGTGIRNINSKIRIL